MVPLAAIEVVEEKTYMVSPESSPPALLQEEVPTSPGSGTVWVRGHWKWEGQWVWVKGHWASTPHPEANWTPGYWSHHHHGGWTWSPGYWN